MTVYAHRKPIANAALTWDYDTAKGLYKTDWVCLSYDWDHQYSRQDRGIVERKIMFRKNMGEWNYYIPRELTPGNYELKYFVKDVEGVWSDAFVMNFTLNDAPAMQFVDAKLKPEKSEFTINAIPASENLEIYDAHTRYPYEIKLEMALYNGNTRIGPIKTIFYDSSIAIKNGNDIHWNSIIYQIPNNIQDGNYTFKIEAIDINNANIREGKIFNVGVFTPVELVPNMPEKVIGGMNIDVSAFTSKYASVVNAVIFSGTNYQCNLNLSSKLLANTKEWENKYNIPLNIPEGKYETKYTAITPAGKSETKSVEFEVESLQITGVTIEGYWNHWRGQKDIFGKQLLNQPHRFLGLEKVKININTDGYADKVEVRFSPELEAMNYIDEYGNYYDYAEDFNLDYVYFPKTILLDETKKENNVYWEYVLPLAKSTISWEDQRIKTPYKMEVTAWKGEKSVKWIIDDIDITGNIYDLTYIQPIN